MAKKKINKKEALGKVSGGFGGAYINVENRLQRRLTRIMSGDEGPIKRRK